MDQEDVRLAIYHGFAEDGRAPSVERLVDDLGATEAEVLAALADLHAERHVVLDATGRHVVMAHPFASIPLGSRPTSPRSGSAARSGASDRSPDATIAGPFGPAILSLSCAGRYRRRCGQLVGERRRCTSPATTSPARTAAPAKATQAAMPAIRPMVDQA